MWVQIVGATGIDHLVAVSDVSPELLGLALCHPAAANVGVDT